MLRIAIPWRSLLLRTQVEHNAIALPTNDRRAKRLVIGVWVAMFALLLVYVAKVATKVPLLDEYFNVPLLADPLGTPFSRYWAQHNEHRIPLPKLLFVLAVKLTGNDFRAPPFMNALLLAVAAAVLMRSVARARGSWSYTDALIPLLVMSLGQHDNLFWGFQVQFISSTVLALFLLAIVIEPRFAKSPSRVAGIGAITLLEPLCGANGVAMAPAFACLLLAVAVHNFRAGRHRLAGLAFAFGLAWFAMVPLYFHNLQPATHHTMAKSWSIVAENAVNFTAIGFGSVAFLAHGTQATGIAEYGIGMVVLLALTALLLARHLRTSERRMTALGLGCAMGGVLCLGLGLAYGRGSMTGLLATNRYSTLAMPLILGVYLAWTLLPSRFARILPMLLIATVLAGFWSNTSQAVNIGKIWRQKQDRIEFEIRSGMPVTFAVDRHHNPDLRETMRIMYLTLRELRAGPFVDLVDDRPLDETEVPVNIVRTEGVVRDERGFYRVEQDAGSLVIALPRRQHVHGFKLRYEGESPVEHFLFSMVSWEPGGAVPPRPGYGIVEHVHPAPAPVVTHIFADRETDTFRIDLFRRNTAIRIHGLSLLSPR